MSIENAKRSSFIQFLKGDLSQKVDVPIFKLIIFLSSTSTDTHYERYLFIDKIVPEINEKYRQHGISIILSDMRVGVKNDNSLEHT